MLLNHFDLHLPPSVIVKGGLPASQSPEELVSDMLEIDLPDGTTIDVGWVPEHEVTGAYRVVFRDHWDAQVRPAEFVRSPAEVVFLVQSIVQARSVSLPAPLPPTGSWGNGVADPAVRE